MKALFHGIKPFFINFLKSTVHMTGLTSASKILIPSSFVALRSNEQQRDGKRGAALCEAEELVSGQVLFRAAIEQCKH